MPFVASAQLEKVAAAINSLQNGKLDSARVYIDEAVLHPETKNGANAWRVKAQVYKTIYTDREKSNKLSPARKVAIDAIKKALELEKDPAAISDLKKAIKYLGSTYYNDAAQSIDSLDYEKASINFEEFTKCVVIYDTSSQTIKNYRIEFLLALETVYSKLYRADKKANMKFFDYAVKALEDVLKMDKNNFNANKNLGLLYHNKTVDEILNLDYGTDLIDIDDIEDKHKGYLNKALPYALKAHELNPKDVSVIRMLIAIYFGLNDEEKKALFEEKLKALEQD